MSRVRGGRGQTAKGEANGENVLRWQAPARVQVRLKMKMPIDADFLDLCGFMRPLADRSLQAYTRSSRREKPQSGFENTAHMDAENAPRPRHN